MRQKDQQNTSHKSPTSHDVARKAGVSQAAVSHVLNGAANGHVSMATRVKILQAAQELGYHTHPSARSLRTGQSDEICCIVNMPSSLFTYDIHLSIVKQIFLHGYIPVFYVSPGTSTDQWQEALQTMFARHPKGVILSDPADAAEDFALAKSMCIEHMVLIAPRPMESVPTLVYPGSSPGYIAAQHLLAKGHHHLGIIQPDDPRMQSFFQQRLEGVRAAINETNDAAITIMPLHLSLAAAHTLADTFLMQPDRPTGIYTFNDEYALPLHRALVDRRVQIPKEIALIGTNNLPFCEYVRPALTSIRVDSAEIIGRRAVDMLISQITGNPLESGLSYTLEPELIAREST